MRLEIVIPRRPVSVNAAYARARFSQRRGKRGGKGFFMTDAGRHYREAVRAYAMLAVRASGWPKAAAVKAVSLEITTWNTRHDADAAVKLTADSLEGIVYVSDRVVQSVIARKASDGGSPRVEITVELCEEHAA